METGNIIHEQIEIEDAKKACVKIGGIVGRNSCDWTLDVVIDGEVYTGLEICYHCQNEEEFTPKKAFDVFDYGMSVFVLCNVKEDEEGNEQVERKVIGLASSGEDAYPKLCGLKRFFAKVQQIGSDGYPMWDTVDPLYPVPICKYYWIYFDEDGSVRAEEVKNHSFIDPDEAFMALMEEVSSLLRQYADGSLSLDDLVQALYDLADQHANATQILDRVTDIPEGSDSVFAKAFMLHVGECDQRYVAEQHLLMKDRQIKFDQGMNFPITNCTEIQYSPPNRFYCNVDTGDMVWSHIEISECHVFLGLTLHVDLEDGSIGASYPFDLYGYENYFNPPPGEVDGDRDGYHVVSIDGSLVLDLPFDLVPEITEINGTLISGYMVPVGRPVVFTFDVVTAESHWHGGESSQDSKHILWTEKGFEAVPCWHFEQEINPKEKGTFNYSYHDDDDYGPPDYNDMMTWFQPICESYSKRTDVDCTACHAKCHHAVSVGHNRIWQVTQEDNGKSSSSFVALGKAGEEHDWWDTFNDSNTHETLIYWCRCPIGWYNGVWCSVCAIQEEASPKKFFGNRDGWRNDYCRISQSYDMAWINNNVTYIKKSIDRTYNNRSLHFKSYAPWQGTIDDPNAGHCGGLNIDDFNRWTQLSACLQIAASAPDFMGPFIDLEGWPPWPDGYDENIWYQGDPDYCWQCKRSIDTNDIQEPYIREFDMGDEITFPASTYEIPYYLDDRSTDPSAGLVVAAKGYQDYSNAAGSSHWKIYHDGIDVTDKVLDALKCDPAVLVTIGMV